MLVLDQGMQQKLSNSWKLGCKSEYEDEMAEDGDGPGVTSTSSPPSITTNGGVNSGANGGSAGPGSIVNSLLLKKTGSYFGVESSPGSGLEQKIKELKAEKEASNGEVVVKKCPGSLNDQDSPIDFSVKRRSSFSGSLTDDSQGSSCSPPNSGDYRGLSPSHDFTNTINPDPHDGDVNVKHEVDSFYEDQKPDIIGQPKVSSPPLSNMPSLLNGIGALPGIPPGLLTNGSSALDNFSQVISAANKMNEQHRNNRKNSRPFKAYPKEALQLPLGFLGMPGFTALQQGMDSGVFAGMSSNEIMTLYNQQLQLFKEKQLSSSNNSGKSSPPSQISSTTSSINGNITNSRLNGHVPHLMNNPNSLNHNSPPHSNSNPITKHQIHSPGLAPPAPSPPLPIPHDQNSPPHFPTHLQHHQHHQHHHSANLSPDHLKPNGLTSSTASSIINNINHNSPFPLPPPLPHLPNNSIHNSNSNTLVSSTSPSSSSPFNLNQSGNNQRKRPRSLPDDQKDEAYWERRRKNNDAAKRSRDARRAKEDEIALRAALLEQENLKLRVEVAALKTETARLRCMLYNT